MNPKEIDLSKIKSAYFIRLGAKQKWAEECIENSKLRLGYANDFHEDCVAGNFEKTRQYFLDERTKTGSNAEGTASSDIRQIKTFYEAGEDSIFITLYRQKLYWCVPSPGIEEMPNDKTRIRQCSGWFHTDQKEREMTFDNVSSIITRTHAMQGTICEYRDSDSEKRFSYLICRLSGQEQPETMALRESRTAYLSKLGDCIKRLNWQDFESLVQTTFLSSGYVENGKGKGTKEGLDLNLTHVVSQRKLFVQIKTSTNYNEFNDYYERFQQEYLDFDDFFYVYHSTTDPALEEHVDENHVIIDLDRLCVLVANSGLAEWVDGKLSYETDQIING